MIYKWIFSIIDHITIIDRSKLNTNKNTKVFEEFIQNRDNIKVTKNKTPKEIAIVWLSRLALFLIIAVIIGFVFFYIGGDKEYAKECFNIIKFLIFYFIGYVFGTNKERPSTY